MTDHAPPTHTTERPHRDRSDATARVSYGSPEAHPIRSAHTAENLSPPSALTYTQLLETVPSTAHQHQPWPPRSVILSSQAPQRPSTPRSRHHREMCSRPFPSTLASPYRRRSSRTTASITRRPTTSPVRLDRAQQKCHTCIPPPTIQLTCVASRVPHRCLRRLQHTAARYYQQSDREESTELAHLSRPPLPPHRGHGACSPHKPNARDPSQAHTITIQSYNQPSCFVIAGR